MKRYLSTLVIFILVFGLFAGCGNQEVQKDGQNDTQGQGNENLADKEDDQEKAKSNVTLTEMVSQGWTTEGDDELAKQFEEETGIKIDIQITPADQHHDLLKTRLNTGEAPDVFWVQTNPFAIKTELDPENNCIDFTDEDWVSVMSPERVKSVSYNDRVYGLMLWHNSPEYTVFYNKTLFSELGIEKTPTNYQEFKDAAGTILEAGIVPIYEYVPAGWHHVLPFAQIGGRYEEANPGLFDKLNNNEIKMADVPEMEETLEQIKEFAELGYYGDDFMSNDGNDMIEQLATRKAAMVYENPGFVKEIEEAYPDTTDEYGIFLIPFADNQTYPVNPNGPARFAYNMSKNTDEIKEYFRFLTKKENLQYNLDKSPAYTNLDVTVDIDQHWLPLEEELLANISEDKYRSTLQSSVKYVNEQWMEIGKDMEAMFVGAITPKEILQNIDERREKMARAQNDPAWD